MALPFIKDETEGTRNVAFWSGVAITFGLAAVSLFGVWAEPSLADGVTDINWGIVVGKLFYSLAVIGAEFLTAVALYRAITASDKRRQYIGLAVFVGLAWFCVHNVERGIHRMYPVVFDADAQQLRDLATLSGAQATNIDTAATTAVASIPEQLATARTDYAKLEAELKLISGDGTESSIKRAQSHLQGLAYYDGDIDGLWEDKTKTAVLRRGNEIRSDMEIQKGVISQLVSGAPVSTTATASNEQSKNKIEQEAKARKREEFGAQITTGAWVLEGARSLTFYVYLSAAVATALMRRREEIELAKLDKELADVKASASPPSTPDPVTVAQPAASSPVIPDEPPPIELTEAQRRSRAGGLAAGQAKAAARAKAENVILVPSLVARDAELQAAKVAAQ